jgi:UDP-N-acetylglucosamine--N-acetylmuramyl-(pentapeptide) pyrophosphoryl-undecaprenol N-acetylglucosamine transferase
MSLRIAIACGGTGGHLFPGVAVAEELIRRGHNILLLVSCKQIDALALEGRSHLRSRALPGIGWPGVLSPQLPSFFMKLAQSWSECRSEFEDFHPSAVLGMGGFTSAVPLMLARRRNVPTLIHESNAFPGRVTRLVAPRVSRILLGFGACAAYLRGERCVVTGTPVRLGLERIDRAQAAERYGLNPQAKTVLIMGGSQGARGINNLVIQALPLWQERRDDWQFIHLTGTGDSNIAEINYRRNRLVSVVKPFSQEMEHLYSLADVVISRSGASSLTEISHYGLPSILIPFPAAADDHQTKNAQVFEERGAALVFAESKLTPERLSQTVKDILENESYRNRLSKAAQALAGAGAAERVAEEIEKCIRN